jgi:hypothetical protein
MAVDRYTKAVLTVIAACLVYLCVGRPGLIPGAEAQPRPEPARVIVAGFEQDGSGYVRRLPLPVKVE